MRRVSTVVSFLFAAVSTFLLTAPAAFAETMAPPASGGTPATATPIAHHSGLYPWELGLIIAAGLVLLAAVIAMAFRLARRSVLGPAVP